jgi:anti-anti-sigma regulatory factor
VKKWAAWLFKIQHEDGNVERRGRIALIVAGGLACGVFSFIPFAMLGDQRAQDSVPIIGVAFTCIVLAMAVMRRGWINSGITLLLVILALAVSGSMLKRGEIGPAPFYFVVLIIVASVTLPSRAIWLVLGLIFVWMGIVIQVLRTSAVASSLDISNIAGSIVVLSVAAFIGYLGGRGVETALQKAREAQAAATHAAGELEHANQHLEQRVAERTSDLEAALVVQREQAAALVSGLERQEQLNQVISALSVPVIPVQKDVLVVPLVGNIAVSGADQMIQTVLQAIEAHRARTIFLDVTGVVAGDAEVAQALVQTTNAARLLGADPILVGVRPEIAQALTALGTDLGQLRTAASLESGLAKIMTRRRNDTLAPKVFANDER